MKWIFLLAFMGAFPLIIVAQELQTVQNSYLESASRETLMMNRVLYLSGNQKNTVSAINKEFYYQISLLNSKPLAQAQRAKACDSLAQIRKEQLRKCLGKGQLAEYFVFLHEAQQQRIRIGDSLRADRRHSY